MDELPRIRPLKNGVSIPLFDAKVFYDLGVTPQTAAGAFMGYNVNLFDRAISKWRERES